MLLSKLGPPRFLFDGEGTASIAALLGVEGLFSLFFFVVNEEVASLFFIDADICCCWCCAPWLCCFFCELLKLGNNVPLSCSLLILDMTEVFRVEKVSRDGFSPLLTPIVEVDMLMFGKNMCDVPTLYPAPNDMSLSLSVQPNICQIEEEGSILTVKNDV